MMQKKTLKKKPAAGIVGQTTIPGAGTKKNGDCFFFVFFSLVPVVSLAVLLLPILGKNYTMIILHNVSLNRFQTLC